MRPWAVTCHGKKASPADKKASPTDKLRSCPNHQGMKCGAQRGQEQKHAYL